MANKILVFVFVACLSACNEGRTTHIETSSSDSKVIRTTDPGQDFYVPSKIWDRISGVELKENFVPVSNMVFVPVKVQLIEKNSGVLSHPKIIFDFNKGGGEVNLADVVTGRGTFYVKFDFQGFAVPETLKVYYISAGLKRRLDGKIVGTGCNTFFDVTKFISEISFKDGFAVNTTRDSHLTVLGGHFIFSYIKDKQTYVTQVTFKDSKNPHLLCENLLEKKTAAEKKLREGSAG